MIGKERTMDLNEYGFIRQVTPRGRETWVSPEFYPLGPAELAETDDYYDWLDTRPEAEDDYYAGLED